MRSSLSLQRSLFRHQARQIAAHVESGSARFKAYQRRYEQATRRSKRVISLDDVHARVAAADVVYVGDYHTLRAAQTAYLELVKAALRTRRRVVLALEFVETKAQATLDAFLAKKISEKKFLEAIGTPFIWPGFAPILELARVKKLEVLAIDRRAKGPRSLDVRDEAASKPIAEALNADDRPLVMVLMGQYHVAPGHLPKHVEARLAAPPSSLIVYQNAEAIYWSLARRGLVATAPAVEISATELCLFNASPVVSQRSFLDYVEAEVGDSFLDERGIAQTFRHLAKDIGRFIGVPVGRKADEVIVGTAADLDSIERITRRGRFTGKELRSLEKHLASRESAFIPRANAVWLSSMSLNHAAEEAAHLVRFLCVGEAMEKDRPRNDTFWARCFEEALGFLGSRLINPSRRCTSLAEWTWHFQQGTTHNKRIAAFVLAIDATLHDNPAEARTLVPQGDDELFNAVSHAVGYLAGERLAEAFAAKRLARADVRALFRDRLEAPALTFAALQKALRSDSKRQAAKQIRYAPRRDAED